MTNENVNTETSVEFQEYQNAVLNGITWTTMTDPTNNNQLHIGQVANYQIYLSESPNFYDEKTGIRTYTMSLWEMTVKTKNASYSDAMENLIITRPGFIQLINDMVIHAADINTAKVEAVSAAKIWDQNRLNDAVTAHKKFAHVFNNLPQALSQKIIAAKGTDSVSTLNISKAAITALRSNEINVIGQIANMTVKEFTSIKGLGGSWGKEVLFAIKSLGITMAEE